jgi:hypothetical protein
MGIRKINMGQYQPTAKDFKHMRWCINNEIKISPTAFSTYEWYIDIEINNKKNTEYSTYVFSVLLYYYLKQTLMNAFTILGSN